MIKIKNRLTGNVICSAETYSEAAEKNKANLWGASLQGANLRYANLQGADLRYADLRYANLWGASLQGAYLQGANLRGANLQGASLQGADLQGAKNISQLDLARQLIVPVEGTFVGWKKLRNGLIAKLQIVGERMNSVGSRKCRASLVHVLKIYDGETEVHSGFDQHTGKLEYKVGEFVKPDKYDPDIFVECSHGIHFFLTQIEAENY